MANACSCYQIRNMELINSITSLRALEKNIENKEKISYASFNRYHEEFFQAVIVKSSNFDSVLCDETLKCGNMLLKIEVELGNDLEENEYNTKRLELSNYIAGYMIENGLLQANDNTVSNENIGIGYSKKKI